MTGFSAALFAQNATELGENIRKYELCRKNSKECEDVWFILSFIFLITSMVFQITHAFMIVYTGRSKDF